MELLMQLHTYMYMMLHARHGVDRVLKYVQIERFSLNTARHAIMG
jgi:hypothetical protein